MANDTTNPSPAFQLKASLYTLTTLHLLTDDLDALDAQINKLRQQAPKFFHSAPIIVDLQRLEKTAELDFPLLQKTLKQHHLIVVGLRHVPASLKEAASDAGFAILPDSSASKNTGAHGSTLSKTKATEKAETEVTAAPETAKATAKTTDKASHEADSTQQATEDASAHSSSSASASLIVTQPVRSGQQIYAQNCDLIVTSSVSPGAELIADGNIHVYGSLRGKALAGVKGNEEARIFCHDLAAELVSIAGHYWLSEDIAQNVKPKEAVQVMLKDGNLELAKIMVG